MLYLIAVIAQSYIFLHPVSDTSELVFEMKLFPEATSEVLRNAYIVFHASNSSAIVEGQVINISLRCETSATFHLLQSHTVTVEDEAEDWLELSLDMSSLPWPSSENCTFSAHTTGNCSSLDALLALYDYSEHGGLDIRSLVSNTVEKRSAGDGTNKTLLSEYTASGLNCSVQSIFLDYATGFPVFPRSIVVISPNRVGINMTFCFGTCSPVSAALPLNITSTERRLFVMQAASGPTPRACCVPDQIEHESLMIFDEELELVSIQSFPQVVTCHCVI